MEKFHEDTPDASISDLAHPPTYIRSHTHLLMDALDGLDGAERQSVIDAAVEEILKDFANASEN
jgi:hypothetical protein